MSLPFLYHLIISSIIFYILATGFKFFLKLRLTMDFSYIAIVIFGSYVSALLNIHYGMGMVSTMAIARVASIGFTFLILFLSRRLGQVYFIVGTLALYMFFFQLALNRESLTGGSFGLSGIQRVLRGTTMIHGLGEFLVVAGIIGFIVIVGLRAFKSTYFYRVLQGRGENETVLKVLGIEVSRYTFVMILITSLCAVIGGNLYAFYYLYIDPTSFRLPMLIMILVIAFVSYKQGELPTFLVAVGVTFGYEYLRFFKVVDPAQLGYLRECLFALAIMITSYITFKRTAFGRNQ